MARHPQSERFHALLKEIGELHDLKQADYGRYNDPLANCRASEEWGIAGWVGTMVRANDKMRRLQQYAKVGRLSNEGARDSFLDLAVYSLIALCLWEEYERLPETSSADTFSGSGHPAVSRSADGVCVGCDTDTQKNHNIGCPQRYVPAA